MIAATRDLLLCLAILTALAALFLGTAWGIVTLGELR